MAGKMGNETVTLKNLEVVEVGEGFVWIKGVVPGTLNAAVMITATGKKDKNFPGVLKAEETKETDETNPSASSGQEGTKETGEVIESVGSAVAEETPAQEPKEQEALSEVQAEEKKEEEAK